VSSEINKNCAKQDRAVQARVTSWQLRGPSNPAVRGGQSLLGRWASRVEHTN